MMYKTKLDVIETEIAIKEVKDFFERNLAKKLDLTRVSAPLFVTPESGLNDDLNGIERAVAFDTKCKQDAVIVHSLAKWKRMALHKYGFDSGKGLYTDMNAIRRDEDLSPIHSYYVDQWDWEKVLEKDERTTETLQKIVGKIYSSLKDTENHITEIYPQLSKKLPEDITFVTSQELEKLYPDLTSKEREHEHARRHGAIFISEIGKVLESGEKHDGRAPDYDDWDLNGDIIVYYEPLDIGLELSSMGIRVSEESLARQLEIAGEQKRKELEFHKKLLAGELPYTIGGGIGQSRLCLFFLDKLHIGEVQASLWPKEILEDCKSKNIPLL
ncbi:aspartate--ammonia ligase [Candidatus Cetobacterium colombiensis]|uniref:Aspartate--ammonia ligase n=1 Tax=Candidatus Cetobacterium colombiensis TaxID=3073100 RepID=A0ABU4W697_9FUSO|nr:aspartate--ammonia ligase [Candidatus Cetobacterium colombiensis]MDX8335042.1 aspartate--ammonia ligase [Candidatus Cetobacterium colombiensis]